MSKKKVLVIVIIVLVIIIGLIVFNVIGEINQKKASEKIRRDDDRDKAALKMLDNACEKLVDEEGNYNVGGPETEIVCEKAFCHITYQGENYGVTCSERE